jgi:O-antigen ligase
MMTQPIQLRVQTENPIQRIGVWILMLLLLAIFSRLQDHVSYLHLPAILLALGLIASFVSGGLYRALQPPLGRYLTALTFWLGLACVFSIWRGGSVPIYLGTWLTSYAQYMVVAGLLIALSDLSFAIWISVIGIFYTALSSILTGVTELGRTSTGYSRFGDPNDLAQILIVGICLCGAAFSSKKSGLIGRVLVIALAFTMLVAMARTGSRGGFIGVLVVLGVLMIQSSVLGKIRIVLICLLIAICSAALMPRVLLSRYLTVLGDKEAEQHLSDGAAASVQSRKQLLLNSLYITAQHPLLGVGPGNFMMEDDTIARSVGLLHGAWHETHNMYTQMSSEAGLPALFFFTAMYVWGLKNLNAVCRAGRQSHDPVIQDAAAIAFWMRLAVIALMSTGFFLSVAYAPEPLVLLAMTVCLERAVRTRMATIPAPAPIPMPARPAPAARPKDKLSRPLSLPSAGSVK